MQNRDLLCCGFIKFNVVCILHRFYLFCVWTFYCVQVYEYGTGIETRRIPKTIHLQMLCFCISSSICEAVERVSDLQQGLFGSCKQVDGWREFLEEVGSQISQSDALSPVHQQIQVGPDLHSSRPLVETTSGPFKHIHNNIYPEVPISAIG